MKFEGALPFVINEHLNAPLKDVGQTAGHDLLPSRTNVNTVTPATAEEAIPFTTGRTPNLLKLATELANWPTGVGTSRLVVICNNKMSRKELSFQGNV